MLNFFRSFGYAIKGIRAGLVQRNFIVQLCCAAAVVVLGLWFDITGIEWCILLI
ncbi:MAG: diacylglycerol kinase, partial [Bacteroidia bacterium]